jgi:hypothetical protein
MHLLQQELNACLDLCLCSHPSQHTLAIRKFGSLHFLLKLVLSGCAETTVIDIKSGIKKYMYLMGMAPFTMKGTGGALYLACIVSWCSIIIKPFVLIKR